MTLAFFTDPATGVIRPPVTVFNGGKRKSRKSKSKAKRKAKKTMRKRR